MPISHQTYTWSQFVDLAKMRTELPLRKANSMKTSDPEWSGSDTFEQALDVARMGWPSGTARIQSGLEQAAALSSYYQVPPVIYDVAGELPDVGAYCAGEPLHMMSWDVDGQSGAAPIIELAVCGTQWHGMKAHQIEHYGLALLSAVDALERAGKDVVLYWYEYSEDNSGQHGALREVLLKDAGEHIEIDRMAFALAHPSMTRRLRFAVAEILSEDFEAGGITYQEMLTEKAVIDSAYGIANKNIPAKQKAPGRYYAPNMMHIRQHLNTLDDAMKVIGRSIDKHLGIDEQEQAA